MSKTEITKLSEKKEVIMNHFWDKGELFVRELRELYPEPKPHFNTLSTQVRTLEANGYLSHKVTGATFQFYAAVSREEYSDMNLDSLIGKCFENSYVNAISALIKKEKVTVNELQQLIDQVQKGI